MKQAVVLSLILAVVLTVGGVAGAEDFSLRAGAWFGNADVAGDLVSAGEKWASAGLTGKDTGYYLGGELDLGEVSFSALTGKVSGTPTLEWSIPGWEESGSLELSDLTGSASVSYILGGFDLGKVSIGGGWASMAHRLSGPLCLPGGYYESEDELPEFSATVKGEGFGVSAFGSLPLGEKFAITGSAIYVPSASVTASATLGDYVDVGASLEEKGTMLGFEVGAVYALSENWFLEGGYRSFRLDADFDEFDWGYHYDSVPSVANGGWDLKVDGKAELDGLYLGCRVVF